MTPEHKQQAQQAIEGWQSVRNDDPMKPAGDVLAALLQELVDAPETEPVAYLPGGFRVEHRAIDDPVLTDEANRKYRFSVSRIEPPYHEHGVWFGETFVEAVSKACVDMGIEYTAPQPPSVPDGWRGLTDVEWMNIVNFDSAYSSYDKEGAVNEAVKRTEAKLKELNAAQQQEPPADLAPDGWRSAIAKEFPLYDEGEIDEDKHCCEWVMLQERKRLHKILAAPTPADAPADVARDSVASEPVGYLYTNLQSGEYHVSDADDDYRGPERALWCIEPVYRRAKGKS